MDFPPGFGNRTLIDKTFEAAGIARHVVVEALGIENGVQFVAHGVGLGILPGYAVSGVDAIPRRTDRRRSRSSGRSTWPR